MGDALDTLPPQLGLAECEICGTVTAGAYRCRDCHHAIVRGEMLAGHERMDFMGWCGMATLGSLITMLFYSLYRLVTA